MAPGAGFPRNKKDLQPLAARDPALYGAPSSQIGTRERV